jgi:hypothetical protein
VFTPAWQPPDGGIDVDPGGVRRRSLARDLAEGALAGIVATAPMTAAMLAMHRRLPSRQRYPLPPRLITEELADRAGADHARAATMTAAAWLAHVGYGGATGALLAPLARRVPLPRSATGAGFGVLVWGVSYLGWLPAARILRPATEHPARRNALMIASHLVWGAACGAALAAMDRAQRSRRRDDGDFPV